SRSRDSTRMEKIICITMRWAITESSATCKACGRNLPSETIIFKGNGRLAAEAEAEASATFALTQAPARAYGKSRRNPTARHPNRAASREAGTSATKCRRSLTNAPVADTRALPGSRAGLQNPGNRPPRFIFQIHDRRVVQLHYRHSLRIAARNKTRNRDFSIGVIAIALPVPANQCRADAGDLIDRFDNLRDFQIVSELVSLGVDVGRDVMGHLSGIVAQTYTPVEFC